MTIFGDTVAFYVFFCLSGALIYIKHGGELAPIFMKDIVQAYNYQSYSPRQKCQCSCSKGSQKK